METRSKESQDNSRCPQCGAELEYGEIITYRTTGPYEDDGVEMGWYCNLCNYSILDKKIIANDYGD